MCLTTSSEMRVAGSYRARDFVLAECAGVEDKYKKFTFYPAGSLEVLTAG